MNRDRLVLYRILKRCPTYEATIDAILAAGFVLIDTDGQARIRDLSEQRRKLRPMTERNHGGTSH